MLALKQCWRRGRGLAPRVDPLLEALHLRMAREDQAEQSLSSFASEVEDVKAMLAALGGPCLLLFDEFGRRWRLWRGVRRSTSVECGMALGW